jgi:hypothetical protein
VVFKLGRYPAIVGLVLILIGHRCRKPEGRGAAYRRSRLRAQGADDGLDTAKETMVRRVDRACW